MHVSFLKVLFYTMEILIIMVFLRMCENQHCVFNIHFDVIN